MIKRTAQWTFAAALLLANAGPVLAQGIETGIDSAETRRRLNDYERQERQLWRTEQKAAKKAVPSPGGPGIVPGAGDETQRTADKPKTAKRTAVRPGTTVTDTTPPLSRSVQPRD